MIEYSFYSDYSCNYALLICRLNNRSSHKLGRIMRCKNADKHETEVAI